MSQPVVMSSIEPLAHYFICLTVKQSVHNSVGDPWTNLSRLYMANGPSAWPTSSRPASSQSHAAPPRKTPYLCNDHSFELNLLQVPPPSSGIKTGRLWNGRCSLKGFLDTTVHSGGEAELQSPSCGPSVDIGGGSSSNEIGLSRSRNV